MKYLNQLSSGRSTRCLLFLTVLGLLTLTSIRSYGQTWPPCPPVPTNIPPTGNTWTSATLLTPMELCPGQFCNVRICYAYRQVFSTYELTITSIMIANCDGCHPDLNKTIDQVFTLLLDQNPMGFPCRPCPQPTTIYTILKGQCWHLTLVSGVRVYEQCSGGAYCRTSYAVCCDETDGIPHRVQTGNSQSFGTCNPDCGQDFTISCP